MCQWAVIPEFHGVGLEDPWISFQLCSSMILLPLVRTEHRFCFSVELKKSSMVVNRWSPMYAGVVFGYVLLRVDLLKFMNQSWLCLSFSVGSSLCRMSIECSPHVWNGDLVVHRMLPGVEFWVAPAKGGGVPRYICLQQNELKNCGVVKDPQCHLVQPWHSRDYFCSEQLCAHLEELALQFISMLGKVDKLFHSL